MQRFSAYTLSVVTCFRLFLVQRFLNQNECSQEKQISFSTALKKKMLLLRNEQKIGRKKKDFVMALSILEAFRPGEDLLLWVSSKR